eukprot:scaffold1593_cov143-Isochrysis_galbana.AAC.4
MEKTADATDGSLQCCGPHRAPPLRPSSAVAQAARTLLAPRRYPDAYCVLCIAHCVIAHRALRIAYCTVLRTACMLWLGSGLRPPTHPPPARGFMNSS